MEIDSYFIFEFLYKGVRLEAKTSKERISSETSVLYLPAHHRFFNSFNEKFKQMIEAGLIDQYIRALTEIFKLIGPREKLEEPYKILTLEELEAGFVVCMVSLFLAVAVFFLEWIVRLKDLVVAYFIFQMYFKAGLEK